MNNIWSKYIQGTKTLYYTRKLRFDDMFSQQYKILFNLDIDKQLKILEIGCGPGALAGALHRWYPKAEIFAVDRDSDFISFAKEHEKGIAFFEGDAQNLLFDDNTFDVTISNTVAEHMEPSVFYGEQLRVLKPGGICLVLSSRKGINVMPEWMSLDEYEQEFWKKIEKYDHSNEKYNVCGYPMNEAQLPEAMEKYGFKNVSTGYSIINLTPDNPEVSAAMAHDMINANRYTAVEAIDAALQNMPNQFTFNEIENMKSITNNRYDLRMKQYERGEKQWDTNVTVIMVVRGVK